MIPLRVPFIFRNNNIISTKMTKDEEKAKKPVGKNGKKEPEEEELVGNLKLTFFRAKKTSRLNKSSKCLWKGSRKMTCPFINLR
jgi:hypothetical protein